MKTFWMEKSENPKLARSRQNADTAIIVWKARAYRTDFVLLNREQIMVMMEAMIAQSSNKCPVIEVKFLLVLGVCISIQTP